MKPINSSYDVEMDEFYGVKKENLEDITDWNSSEKKWYDWLQSLPKDETTDIIQQELKEFIYNILLHRNLKVPEFKNGVYRANKVIKINKLMSRKGGLKPWGLTEIKCSGLYTIHPVWFFEEEALPENINSMTTAQLEEIGFPDICLRTGKVIRFKGDKEKGIADKEVYCWLENTPFIEAQISFNSNWEPVWQMEAYAGQV